MQKQNHLSKAGVTFVEMLIVVSIFALVSVSLYSALANGIRVWDKSKRIVVEEDLAIFFDKISQDLHNVMLYSDIRYSGSMSRFAFPTLITTEADRRSSERDAGYVRQIGKVEYYYDPTKDSVVRRESNFSQALAENYGKQEYLAKSIERIHFQYYYLTDTGPIYSEQILDGFPSGVEVKIEFRDDLGKREMKKFIEVPVGRT